MFNSIPKKGNSFNAFLKFPQNASTAAEGLSRAFGVSEERRKERIEA